MGGEGPNAEALVRHNLRHCANNDNKLSVDYAKVALVFSLKFKT